MKQDRWRKIEQIYHQALRQDPDERADFVKEACGSDETLLREIESLLRQAPEADRFIESPAVDVAARSLADDQEDSSQALIGKTLSHYRIVEQIGSGGMGVVFRATDTRLDLDVALKVLRDDALADEATRKRFRKEAMALSRLNHSNIATFHVFDRRDEIDFLVMEYVEGITLAKKLAAGPLTEKEAAKLAAQVVDALEEAHDKGVIHRDLKPGNIIVTSKGRAKVLDFGLAKWVKPLSEATTADSLTMTGVAPGTLPYMAPEQLLDETLDGRTDLYALGAVLYEAVAGRRPFQEKEAPRLTEAILHQTPVTPRALNTRVSQRLEQIILKCLEKDPDNRYQSAKEMAVDLRRLRGSSSDFAAKAPAQPLPQRRVSVPLWALALALLVVGTGAAALLRFSRPTPPPPPPVKRFAISLQSVDRTSRGYGRLVTISPDGASIVFTGTQGGSRRLYLRRMGQLEPTVIPGTESAVHPFFSPDGEWIGFFADAKLKKVSLGGGSPLNICETSTDPRGATWGPDGTIIFAAAGGTGLSRISAAGGTPEVLTTLDSEKGEASHRWPEMLPGGEAVLYTVPVGEGGFNVAVLPLKNGEPRIVVRGGCHARYVPTGHLVYGRQPREAPAGLQKGLLAVPFDLARLRVTGSPVSILEGVHVKGGGVAQFSFSDDGSLVYAPGIEGADGTLVWVDRNGTVETISAERREFSNPRLSSDGKRLAIILRGAGASPDVWLYEFARDALTRFTFKLGMELSSAWTPDGKRVAFSSWYTNQGRSELRWKLADGSGEAELLFSANSVIYNLSWSPDGRLLAFSRSGPTTRRDIWLLPVEGDRKPQPFLQTPFWEGQPMFSPDGRWIAYVSDESGQREVYVRPFPGPGGKVQVSTEGGDQPRWAPSGRELFYRNGNKMMAVAITTKPSFTAGTPKELFEIAGGVGYDVAPDGRRFLFIKESEDQPAANQLNVVLNWFEELRRRVPTN